MYTLGVVDYLNALPLYRTLEQSGAVKIIRAVPSQLGEPLLRGDCDAALVPIVDHFRGIGSALISDACIGSSGPVRSVLMFSNVPVHEIRSVAADTSSHTSVALLRVILADGYNVQPALVDHAPNLTAMLSQHDAALLIGDRALEAMAPARRDGINIFDLGAAWTLAIARKPFVFAAWAVRKGMGAEETDDLSRLLSQARDEGVRNLHQIVAENPVRTSLSAVEVEDYLAHAVDFVLTPQHAAGMEEFRLRCRKHNLV